MTREYVRPIRKTVTVTYSNGMKDVFHASELEIHEGLRITGRDLFFTEFYNGEQDVLKLDEDVVKLEVKSYEYGGMSYKD
jgi:hypothetical protein